MKFIFKYLSLFLLLTFLVFPRAGGAGGRSSGGGSSKSSSSSSSYSSSSSRSSSNRSFSSYSSSGSYSSSSQSSTDPGIVFLIALIVIPFIVISNYLDNQNTQIEHNKSNGNKKNKKNKKKINKSINFVPQNEMFAILDLKELQSIQNKIDRLNNFSQDLFLKKVEKTFVKVQRAWSSKNLKSIRNFISDGIYQRFNTQIIMMEKLRQRNIIGSIKILSTKIVKWKLMELMTLSM